MTSAHGSSVLASLAGAAFLVRDGRMAGERITILEQQQIPGGALDGLKVPEKGFVIRGGREMENHFECLWDLFRSIPSLEIEDASVLDEFYWLNKDDPNYSLQRATINRGEDAHTDGLFTLTEQAQKDIIALFLATRQEMENKRIDEVLGRDFLDSNFWLYWRTMFAFEEWHSALEMKLYLHRFIHHIGGLPDFSALKFTRYNQYESLVLPLVKWLQDQGVVFQYGTEVTDVDFDLQPGRQATHIHWTRDGVAGGVDLGADDLLFMTIGSLTENSDNGDHHGGTLERRPCAGLGPVAPHRRQGRGLWPPGCVRRAYTGNQVGIGDGDHAGCAHPGLHPEDRQARPVQWQGGDRRHRQRARLSLADELDGEPPAAFQEPAQGSDRGLGVFAVRGYARRLCEKADAGLHRREITREWLYHLGVPVEEIDELAATGANTVPVMMPYITAFFMPRQAGDRPMWCRTVR